MMYPPCSECGNTVSSVVISTEQPWFCIACAKSTADRLNLPGLRARAEAAELRGEPGVPFSERKLTPTMDRWTAEPVLDGPMEKALQAAPVASLRTALLEEIYELDMGPRSGFIDRIVDELCRRAKLGEAKEG